MIPQNLFQVLQGFLGLGSLGSGFPILRKLEWQEEGDAQAGGPNQCKRSSPASRGAQKAGQSLLLVRWAECKVGAVYTLGQLLPSNLFKSVVAYQHSSTATVKPFKIKTYRRWQDAAPHAYPKAP